jgi:dolichol-phosphate mannosyltransferase
MNLNFWLNNELTFRTQKLKGSRVFSGWLIFMLCCALGGFASLALGEALIQRGAHWAPAGFAGAILAAVWNFSIASTLAWPEKR